MAYACDFNTQSRALVYIGKELTKCEHGDRFRSSPFPVAYNVVVNIWPEWLVVEMMKMYRAEDGTQDFENIIQEHGTIVSQLWYKVPIFV